MKLRDAKRRCHDSIQTFRVVCMHPVTGDMNEINTMIQCSDLFLVLQHKPQSVGPPPQQEAALQLRTQGTDTQILDHCCMLASRHVAKAGKPRMRTGRQTRCLTGPAHLNVLCSARTKDTEIPFAGFLRKLHKELVS